MRASLTFDRAAEADPMDARVTITLLVTSIALSGMQLRGSDFDFLIARPLDPSRDTVWQLFTSALLHGGWLHLGFNVLWTFRFGVLLEALLGSVAFAALVVMLGIGSMGAEWAFSVRPAVGLSGIGFGLFGTLWALDRWHPACGGVLDRRIAELFAAWFLICIAASYYGVFPIANIAHGVGALLGGLVGWSLAVSHGKRMARFGVLGAAFLLIALFCTALRPWANPRVKAIQLMELFERGLAASQADDHQAAIEAYEEALERDDEFWEAWHNVSISYFAVGDSEKGTAARQRAEELAPPERESGR